MLFAVASLQPSFAPRTNNLHLSQLLFLLQRFNALNTILVVTREVHRCLIPDSMGIRKFKFAVVVGKSVLESFFAANDGPFEGSGTITDFGGGSVSRGDTGGFGLRHMGGGEGGEILAEQPSQAR